MSNTYEANINDEYLTDYYSVKHGLNKFRNVFYPVAYTVRGFALGFSKLFAVMTPLHLMPYISNIYSVLDSLRQIFVAPFQKNKTTLQRTITIAKALANIALTALFTFVFHSPYAGTIAFATTELAYNGIVSASSKTFEYYPPDAPKQLDGPRTKENIYRVATAAATVVGAGLLFVPGLQILGASIIILTNVFMAADAFFGFPFPWREKKEDIKKILKPEKTNALKELNNTKIYKRFSNNVPEQPKPESKTINFTMKSKSHAAFFKKEPQKIPTAASITAFCRL